MRKPVLKLHQKALIAGLACAAALPVTSAFAGTDRSYSSSIVELEIIKRQERVRLAYDAEAEGDKLYAKQDFAGAIDRYQLALNTMPNGYSNQADRRRIINKYAKAAVIHSRELGHKGEFSKAKTLLNGVLAENMDPNYRDAQVLLKHLDDPDRFNQAMTPRHFGHTEEVKRHFDQALGFYDLGQFKEAEDEFNRILAIDQYNTAARRGLERTQRQIQNYLKSARDEQRLRMLNAVDSLWVNAVPGTAKVPVNSVGTGGMEDPGSAPISFKLQNITIDHIQFAEADLNEVVQYLRKKSAENDPEADPGKKGVNFINNVKDGAKAVTIDLRNVKLIEALKAATDYAGVRFDVQPNSVVIIPQGTGASSMTIRTYRVPPDFLTRGTAASAAAGGAEAGSADPFAPSAGGAEGGAASTGPKLKGKPTAKEVLASLGVTFTEGAFASFDATSGRLVVKNTYDQLDLVETVVEEIGKTTVKQVYITTKFVEVTQRNNEELGFDWLLGAFNVGGNRVFGSGGTSGNAGALNTSDYSVITPSGAPVGGNPITRGLRFGSDAISRNAIDALIAGGTAAGTSSVTPAAFAIAGVFTDPQFQLMMRALNQKKGVDLMTAPSIIVRGGQRSKIEVIREFPYPTEFDPPQIPQTFGGGGGIGGLGGLGNTQQGSSFPVTPTTPSSFTFRNTGVTMEVEATVGEDGYTIDLNIAPEVVEFEGFINYGSPIQTTGINALGQSEPVVLTENKILQPVFATRKMATQVLIWDRQTVGIGGLIREDVQSVEDRVPIVSAIPIIGRLFKTKNEEHYKKNLMIYVTAQLIDPAGQPVHGDTIPVEEETKVEENLFPPGIPVDTGK
ncbi:MAG TPA: Amuc_1098 family type IV pilus outer membrane protein [Verrucomicrobiales bacterium]|nr:Amuc_1098 family type IV pilus outer membrane protein [Verrucomicrobiales bacterium]